MKGIIYLGLCASSMSYAQADSAKVKEIEAVNFTKRLPVTKEIIRVENLAQKNLGQDLPMLLKNQTSLLSSSDTGNGVGYSDFRIRGVAGTSINVMMNGVPYNDSESQGTFFVNVSDLASSASQILIQRGVGSTSNGAAAFGASVNIITKNPEETPYFRTDQSYGSFDTRKHSFEAGTGNFLHNKFSIMARYSIIKSDGYIDRATSDLQSYNITALFKTEKTKLKFLAFGGKEKTYQSWNGIDENTYKINRKFNSSGAIYQGANIVNFYDNETDNYQQNHYHLILNQNINNHWDLETTLHYTKGKGFYENYKQDQRPDKYNILNSGIVKTDLIRKKWLDNDFYGMVVHIYGKYNNLKINIGGAGNQYQGKHFGNMSSAFGLPQIPFEHEYYRNHSVKNDLSFFGKFIYSLNKFELFGDLQFRHIYHNARVLEYFKGEGGDFSRAFNFLNPKTGINFNFNHGKIYFSYALAHREPSRKDIISKNDIQHETLHDFELGLEKSGKFFSVFANLYYMHYNNQLVFSGKIDNTGAFIRENSGKSFRRGVEFGFNLKPIKSIQILANATWSENKNLNFHVKNGGVLENLGTTEITLSPKFISNIGVSYQLKNFNFGIQNQFVSGQYLDNTQTLAIPDYNLLDFLAGYKLSLKHHELNLYFNLNNLLNRMYMTKGHVYDGAAYYFPQAGRNFMLGMTWVVK